MYVYVSLCEHMHMVYVCVIYTECYSLSFLDLWFCVSLILKNSQSLLLLPHSLCLLFGISIMHILLDLLMFSHWSWIFFLFFQVFLFLCFSFGHFYWSMLKFTDSFLCYLESTNETGEGILFFHFLFFVYSTATWFFFPFLLTLPTWSCMLSTFSCRAFNVLIIFILNSLSDSSNICVIAKVSPKDCFFSGCFSCLFVCLVIFLLLLKAEHLV